MPCGWNNSSGNGFGTRQFRMGRGMGAYGFADANRFTVTSGDGTTFEKLECPKGKVPSKDGKSCVWPPIVPVGPNEDPLGGSQTDQRVNPMWARAVIDSGQPIGVQPDVVLVVLKQVYGAPKGTYNGLLYGFSKPGHKSPIKVRVHELGMKGTQLFALVSNVSTENLR